MDPLSEHVLRFGAPPHPPAHEDSGGRLALPNPSPRLPPPGIWLPPTTALPGGVAVPSVVWKTRDPTSDGGPPPPPPPPPPAPPLPRPPAFTNVGGGAPVVHPWETPTVVVTPLPPPVEGASASAASPASDGTTPQSSGKPAPGHPLSQWPPTAEAYPQLFSLLRLGHFILLLFVTFSFYRGVFCAGADWECNDFAMPDYVVSFEMLTLLGVAVFVSGPTLALPGVKHWVPGAWAIAIASSVVYGGLGNIPALQTSLDSQTDWHHDAAIIVISLLCVVIAGVGGWLAHTASNDERAVSGALIVFALLLYGVPFIVQAAMSNPPPAYFHAHHFWIAFLGTLLLRRNVLVVLVLRFVCVGIMSQGMAAYGPASPVGLFAPNVTVNGTACNYTSLAGW